MSKVLVVIIALLAGILSGALGWRIQLSILFFTFLFSSYYLLKTNHSLKKRLWWISLLLLPWLVTFGSVVIFDRLFHVLVILVVPIVATLVSLLLHLISNKRYFIQSAISLSLLVFFGLHVLNIFQIESTLINIKRDFNGEVIESFAYQNLLSSENKVTLTHFWSVDCSACFKDFSVWEDVEFCAANSNALEVRHVHLAGSEYEKSSVQAALAAFGVESYIIPDSTYFNPIETESVYKTIDVVGVPAFSFANDKKIVVAGNASFSAFSNYSVVVSISAHLKSVDEDALSCLDDVIKF